jgi:hypothetical protein
MTETVFACNIHWLPAGRHQMAHVEFPRPAVLPLRKGAGRRRGDNSVPIEAQIPFPRLTNNSLNCRITDHAGQKAKRLANAEPKLVPAEGEKTRSMPAVIDTAAVILWHQVLLRDALPTWQSRFGGRGKQSFGGCVRSAM